MKKSPTSTDIARLAGVNQSTVSLALRNDPRVASATRERIQKIASELGYEPNSFARAMSVIRRAKRPVFKRGALALLVPEIIVGGAMEGFYQLCRSHGESLGYELNVICFRERKLNHQRLTHILKARGILGIIVLPDFAATRVTKRLQLDWSLFPTVKLGNALLWPPVHRVSDNHFGNAQQLVRELGGLGYRRIGLCVHSSMASLHAEGGWEGGYAVGMQRLGGQIAPFYHTHEWKKTFEVSQWIQREKLDAVIVDTMQCANILFDGLGVNIPKELGLATLMAHPSFPISGINPQHNEVWTRAVDFLVHLIQTQQRGIPQLPQRLLIDGTWYPGETVRKVWGRQNDRSQS